MDLKEIKELIALMKKNDLSVFKMEKEGFKITLKKGVDFLVGAPAAVAPASSVPVAAAPVAGGPTPAAPTGTESVEVFKEITSPMVGTFYGAPSPDAEPFVQVGQEIAPGAVVCIIEAMKVMNEIKAEIGGTVVEVVAENGKPVQFGQTLFKLR